MYHRVLMGMLTCLLMPCIAVAGTTGKLAGVVKDKETGAPLPVASVSLLGTTLGAVTDRTGQYTIINVPPGAYTVRCTYVGYQEERVLNVRISPDFTTTVSFALTSTVIAAAGPIEVVAERPLVQRDQTASVRTVTADELKALPIRGYEAAASLQAGVVKSGDNLHIRGGRLEEIAYYVDGFSQQDLLSGRSTTSINSNAIDQVVALLGGVNAEYGRNMSGVVNVVTKEGGKKYGGSVEYLTDEITKIGDSRWLKTNSYGTNIYAASLGGPIPLFRLFGSDRGTFFGSVERRDLDDRDPRAGVGLADTAGGFNERALFLAHPELTRAEKEAIIEDLENGRLPHNGLEGWSWQGKLNLDLLPNKLNLKLGAQGSKDDSERYSHLFRFNLPHAERRKDFNNSFFGKFTYVFGPRTFLTAAGNYFITEQQRGDGKLFENLNKYGRKDGENRFDREQLFSNHFGTPDSSAGALGFVRGGRYTRRSSWYYGTKIDITSQITPHHQIQAGVDWQRHTLRRYEHLFPILSYLGVAGGGFRDVDRYGYDYNATTGRFDKVDAGLDGAKHPILSAVYLQDKVEYEGIVLNLGLRYDYLSSGTEVLKDENQPLNPNDEDVGADQTKLEPNDLTDNKPHHRFSPRLGIGFPVTDRTVFHLNYGKFFQQPNLEDLFVGFTYLDYYLRESPYFRPIGNPNLGPEETTAYEVGFTRQVGDNSSVDVTAYYKDVEGLSQVQNTPSVPRAFPAFRNRDYGTIKGIDLRFTMRRMKRLAGGLDYGLAFATGTGSTSLTHQNLAWAVGPFTRTPKLTNPLDFDQRHKLSINVDYRFANKDGPQLMGLYPLSNAGVNLLFFGGSGFPYTPTALDNIVSGRAAAPPPTGPINSSYGPWNYRIDLKANKDFIFKNFNISPYIWGINLLDRVNAREVYETSGSPTTTGWLNTDAGRDFVSANGKVGRQKQLLRERNPLLLDTPRQIRFGLIVNFQ